MKIAVVVPTYNERENIKLLIQKIFKIFNKEKINGEVIVIDDSSDDGTAKEVKKLQNKFSVILIERKRKLGLGSAYIEGFKNAIKSNADIIFQMDADLSHKPEDIPKFLEKINSGYDMVIGSRRINHGRFATKSKLRKFISITGNFFGRYIAGIDLSDISSGYRAYHRRIFDRIKLEKIESSGYEFQLEILARVKREGFNISEVPIVFRDRYKGKSKLSPLHIMRFILIALKIRFNFLRN
ncbi:MAG: polyprenol monophosphomannose synthase [Candidatus Altiarchaeota archaeon]